MLLLLLVDPSMHSGVNPGTLMNRAPTSSKSDAKALARDNYYFIGMIERVGRDVRLWDEPMKSMDAP